MERQKGRMYEKEDFNGNDAVAIVVMMLSG